MSKKKLTIDLETAQCTITPLTALQYYRLWHKSLPIFNDYDCFMQISYLLEHEDPPFEMAHLYAALKTIFGESTSMYDDYKCSFGYTFAVEVKKNGQKSKYIFNFVDMKGGLDFYFKRVIQDKEELKKYDTSILYHPFEEEFSKKEMAYLMRWFTFYLVGFMESYREYYSEEFFRSNSSCLMVYGYVDKTFFTEYYEGEEEFRSAIEELEKRNIPYNQEKPNPKYPR